GQQYPDPRRGQHQEQHITPQVTGLHAMEGIADVLAYARREIRQTVDDVEIKAAAYGGQPDGEASQIVDAAVDRPAVEGAAPAGHGESGTDQDRTIKLVEIPLVPQEAVHCRELLPSFGGIEHPIIVEQECEGDTDQHHGQGQEARLKMVFVSEMSFVQM